MLQSIERFVHDCIVSSVCILMLCDRQPTDSGIDERREETMTANKRAGAQPGGWGGVEGAECQQKGTYAEVR